MGQIQICVVLLAMLYITKLMFLLCLVELLPFLHQVVPESQFSSFLLLDFLFSVLFPFSSSCSATISSSGFPSISTPDYSMSHGDELMAISK